MDRSTSLNEDYGSLATITGPSPWSAVQDADLRACKRAGDLAGALEAYKTARYAAFVAEKHGDDRSAEGFRADARAVLHRWPDLLALVEGAT